ncbi:predicted protein [Nematostella vectensis]|uniref:Uncharacterized protein n=1 Tax=Nematostella vectensis TaxID=45351 RepID=A7RU03_NEMVE|nr:predicted protein [Nematostella vectensis]|eukprot:XP_001637241.1 predicted protein [Nematostella vectensis]
MSSSAQTRFAQGYRIAEIIARARTDYNNRRNVFKQEGEARKMPKINSIGRSYQELRQPQERCTIWDLGETKNCLQIRLSETHWIISYMSQGKLFTRPSLLFKRDFPLREMSRYFIDDLTCCGIQFTPYEGHITQTESEYQFY